MGALFAKFRSPGAVVPKAPQYTSGQRLQIALLRSTGWLITDEAVNECVQQLKAAGVISGDIHTMLAVNGAMADVQPSAGQRVEITLKGNGRHVTVELWESAADDPPRAIYERVVERIVPLREDVEPGTFLYSMAHKYASQQEFEIAYVKSKITPNYAGTILSTEEHKRELSSTEDGELAANGFKY